MMRSTLFVLFFSSLLLLPSATYAQQGSPSVEKALGMLMAQSVKQVLGDDATAIDFDALLEGIQAGVGRDLTRDELQRLQQQVQQHADKVKQLADAKAAEAGRLWLADNASKPGVQQTASGLQYEVLRQGSGAKPPSAASKVKVHYVGTLISGKEFDSSVRRGQPAEFGLGQVIKGWTEGLQLMPVGSKYRFFIPSELGYGARGTRGIPPHSVLIFEVELLEIL